MQGVRAIDERRSAARRRVVAVASAVLALAACGREPLRVQRFGGATMGSTYEVQFVSDVAPAEVRRIVERELAAFDLAFSNWRKDSEIARVNAHRSTEPCAVSERFAAVLEQALRIAEATEGAFDPTLKPLSQLYRRAKDGDAAALAADSVEAARARVGHQLVRVADGAVHKQRADVELDLDGIVAGAAADAIGQQLREAGVASFFLQITGEVLCAGAKPGGEPWRVGVVDPGSDAAGGEAAVRALPLRDAALCTSGDYRNVAIVEGRVVHHVFDPRTGSNPEHTVVSASVLSTSCAVADAVGTALMVMGDERAAAVWGRLRTIGVDGVLMLKPGEGERWQQVEIEWPADGS